MTRTVWYRITDSNYPHCQNDMVFVDGLDAVTAEKVAGCLTMELRYILGDDICVSAWAD